MRPVSPSSRVFKSTKILEPLYIINDISRDEEKRWQELEKNAIPFNKKLKNELQMAYLRDVGEF